MSDIKFVPLQQEVSSIEPEYSHLVQVHNASGLMLKVANGRYLLAWGCALVDPSDILVSQLIDSRKLIVVETSVKASKQSNPEPEPANKPKRKSRKKIAAEEKQAIENLGDLFK